MRSSRPVLGRLLVLALCAAPGRTEVIERILALVDGRPLMLSEVEVVQRVRGLDRPAALEASIDEQLMFREASRLPQAVVSAEEEERAFATLQERLGEEDTRAHEPDLRRLVRRQAVIVKYFDFRFRPQVRVEDAEVRRAYEAENGGQEGTPTFEEAAPALRQRLAEEQLDQQIEAWVKELRVSAEIRYNPR
jgi:hypothetical protein